MGKILLTSDNLPEGMSVKQLFGMTQVTGTVEVSRKGMIRDLLEKG